MSDFVQVCALTDLVKDAGVAALVNGQQVALFYLNDQVFAMNNFDPIGKANVMSRGMIGDLKGEYMVASPLKKQHYSLATGQCMDVEGLAIPVYETKVEDGLVFVKV